jgi:hypothetical protein
MRSGLTAASSVRLFFRAVSSLNKAANTPISKLTEVDVYSQVGILVDIDIR